MGALRSAASTRSPRPLARSLVRVGAAAVLLVAGLAPSGFVPAAEGGLLFSTTTTAVMHDAKHHTIVTQQPLGTSLHLLVKVTSSATRTKPSGYVEVRRYSGAGCEGTLRKTVKAKLVDGQIDVLDSAFTSPTPEWVYFRASYLGGGLFAPSITTGCYGINIAAMPKVAFVMHDESHRVLTGDIPTGTLVHPRVTVTGDWGTPVGAARATLYWDDGFVEPCTNAFRQTEFANLEGGIAEVEADWTSTFVRKGWVKVLFSITGDGPNYSSEFSACVPISFKGKPNISADVRTAAGALAGTVKVGAGVRLGATVTGSIGEVSGDVRFRLWKGTTCTGTPAVDRTVSLDLYGHAFTDLTMAAAGSRAYQATYLGNFTYLARSSTCKTFSVVSPTASPTASPTPTQGATPTGAPAATARPGTTAVPAPGATSGPTAGPDATSTPAPEVTEPAASVATTPAPSSAPGDSGAPAEPTPAPSAAPAANVDSGGDNGLLIVALLVFGVGLISVGVAAGIALGRRSRSTP